MLLFLHLGLKEMLSYAFNLNIVVPNLKIFKYIFDSEAVYKLLKFDL